MNEQYDNDFTEEKKAINDKLEKRLLYNRGTATKSDTEKLVGNYLRASGAGEQTDRLTEEVQIKNIEIMNTIKGIASILHLSLDTASKISIDEVNQFKNMKEYHEMLTVIDNVFNENGMYSFTNKQIEASVKIIIAVGAVVPIELVYAMELHSNYAKNQKTKALTDILTTHFPQMKPSNIKAIISSR